MTTKFATYGSDPTQAAAGIANGLRETGGTNLTMAGVTDGEFLKRSGSTIISAAAGGAGGAGSWTAEGAWAVPFVCWPFNSYTSGGGNTSTGTVTAFGTPVSTTPATYGVVITTGGIQGTAIFSLTSTIAATITGITVPAGAGVYVVPGTGISILFGAGTYVVTNTWGWNTVFAAIGDGSLTGHYRVVGDSIDLRLVFTMGTTTDLGGGVGTPTSQGIIIPTPPASVVDGDKLPLLAVSGGVSIKAIQLLVSIGTGVGNTVGLLQFVYKYSAFSQAVVDTDTLSSLAPGNFAMIQMADVPIKT